MQTKNCRKKDRNNERKRKKNTKSCEFGEKKSTSETAESKNPC